MSVRKRATQILVFSLVCATVVSLPVATLVRSYDIQILSHILSLHAWIKRCSSHSIIVTVAESSHCSSAAGISYIKMDSSRLLASVAVALDKLQYRMKQSISRSDEIGLETMIRGLRVVRTFLLCSTLLTDRRQQ